MHLKVLLKKWIKKAPPQESLSCLKNLESLGIIETIFEEPLSPKQLEEFRKMAKELND